MTPSPEPSAGPSGGPPAFPSTDPTSTPPSRHGAARKVLLWIAILLAVLAAAAGLTIRWAGDPNNYKSSLAEAFQAATGRSIVLEGDLRLSVYPWLGIRTGPLKVANGPGFAPEWFLTAKDAAVRIKLMPFLTDRRIEADRISLEGMELYLGRDEHGKTSFQDLADRFGPKPGPAHPVTPAAPAAPLSAGGALLVQGVAMKHALVAWDDKLTGRSFRLTDLEVETGVLAPGRPAKLSLAGDLAVSKPDLHGPVKLSAEVSAGPAGADAGTILARKCSVEATLVGPGLPAPHLALSARADLALSPGPDGRRFALTGIDLTALDLSATGEARGTWLPAGLEAEGSVAVKEFSPEKLLESLGRKPHPARDPQVLKKASLSADFLVQERQLRLPRLEAALDDVHCKGWLGLGLPAGRPRPNVSFNLYVDGLNLDRYLPPPDHARDSREPPLPPTPVAVVRFVDLDGLVRADRLEVHNLSLSGVAAKIDGRDGVLRLDPLNASLYGGSLKANAAFSETRPGNGQARNQVPGVLTEVDLAMSGVQAEPLLTALAGQDRLGGTAALKARLSLVLPAAGRGGNGGGLPLRTLNGQTDLSVRDGFIRGFSLARDKTDEEGRPRFTGPDRQTHFSSLTATATIRNGTAHNRDFRFVTRDYSATGEGSIDLADRTLDYNLYLDLTALPRIPVRLTGPLNKPHVAVNQGEFLTGTAWGLFRLPFSLGEGLLNGIAGGLQGLFEGLSQ